MPATDLQGESLTLLEGEVQEILGDVVLLCQFRFKRTDTAQGEHTWRVTSFAGTERGIEYCYDCTRVYPGSGSFHFPTPP